MRIGFGPHLARQVGEQAHQMRAPLPIIYRNQIAPIFGSDHPLQLQCRQPLGQMLQRGMLHSQYLGRFLGVGDLEHILFVFFSGRCAQAEVQVLLAGQRHYLNIFR